MNARSKPTQVALLTPAGRGAIASIVVNGPQAIAVVDGVFRSTSARSLAQRAAGDIAYGNWAATGEDVVVVRRGESRVEIHCHGGDTASQAILASLVAAGCEPVSWQRFVTEDEQGPIRAAARVDLAAARTERTASILLDQYGGALEASVRRAIDELERGSADAALGRLHELVRWSRLGLRLTMPWRVAICGPPNVGKSTLINALLGYERAIVFDQPGTTRDVVTELTAIDGWPVELADTAGLRTSDEPLEQAGVNRAVAELNNADLALWVFDVSQTWTDELRQLADERRDAIVVHNKADLLRTNAMAQGESLPDRPEGVYVSAKTAWNIPELLGAITGRLVGDTPPPGTAVPFKIEQIEAIRAAIHHAQRDQLPQAIAALKSLLPTGAA
jgi:tRNA modification GTPase